MARNDGRDPLEEVFLHASPNPSRIGCPSQEIIQAIARRTLPLSHEAFAHLAGCSECFREVKAYQLRAAGRRRKTLRAYAAAATILLCITGSVLWVMSGRFSGNGSHQAASPAVVANNASVVYDARWSSFSRGDEDDKHGPALQLIRSRHLHLSMTLALGSDAGLYEIRLCKLNDPNPMCFSNGSATGRPSDHGTVMTATLDTSALSPGEYSLFFRHKPDTDWQVLPARLQ
jgi:hypothetical protein